MKKFSIQYGQAQSRGINLFSNVNPMLCLSTYYDEHGTIQSEVVPKPYAEYCAIEKLPEIKLNEKTYLLLSLILIAIIVPIGVIFQLPGLVFVVFNFIALSMKGIFKIIKTYKALRIQDKNGFSYAKFHAAEHMVINAYQKLQRVPTLEELRKSSRFSRSCGSRKLLEETLLGILVSIATFWVVGHSLAFLAVTLLILITYLVSWKAAPLRFLQFLVTSKPTDQELKLALVAIQKYDEMEEQLEKDPPMIRIVIIEEGEEE